MSEISNLLCRKNWKRFFYSCILLAFKPNGKRTEIRTRKKKWRMEDDVKRRRATSRHLYTSIPVKKTTCMAMGSGICICICIPEFNLYTQGASILFIILTRTSKNTYNAWVVLALFSFYPPPISTDQCLWVHFGKAQPEFG